MATENIWFDPGFGAAGSMVLGALIALGADPEAITAAISQISIDGRAISAAVNAQAELRGGLSCIHATVEAGDSVTHRRWSQIDAGINAAKLPAEVKAGARATFRRLAEVEAGIHRMDIDEVHFHEVGALDAIGDIVGSWIAWHQMGMPSVSVGPFGLGHGTVQAAHGQLPLPAPAVAELLIGYQTRPLDSAMETVTPTGAAVLTEMASATATAPPAGTMLAVGRGAGGRDPAGYPNVLTAIHTDASSATMPENSGSSGPFDEVEAMVELTTNLDDTTGEILGHAISSCLEAGAADAWVTPIVMKKGRPASKLTVLCSIEGASRLRQLILAETGSLGIRQQQTLRYATIRRFETVEVSGHQIRIKVGPHGAKPEFEDLLAAADALGVTPRQIGVEALLRYGQ